MARHRLGSKNEVPEGAAKAVVVEGRPVALFQTAGKFYALDDACLITSPRQADLGDLVAILERAY